LNLNLHSALRLCKFGNLINLLIPDKALGFIFKVEGTMKYAQLHFSIAIFLILFCFYSISQTIVPGGDVYGNWDTINSPYQIMGDITIPNDSTLTVDPGVNVEFQGHYALTVYGRLLAMGTENDTIVFTVNDTTGFYNPDTTLGGWYGINIVDTPVQNDSSKIMYCKIQYGKAVGSGWWLNAGGAICVVNFNKVIISNCLITNNSAGGSEAEIPSGGGIHLAWADVVISNNIISYNTAIAGGAIQIHDSHPVFYNNIFIGNRAQEGGAISTGGIADISFNGGSFINNIAASHGGGIMVWEPENWSFNNVIFSGNEAAWGAGLGLSGGNVVVNDCLFENNTASSIGGGIAADFCELHVSNTTFTNDSSYSLSGGIHNWYCETTISNSTFLNNYALLGGGVFADFSSVKIDSSNFIGNSADAGGALRFWSSNLEVGNVIFEQNHVYNQGGAIEYTVDTGGIAELYQFSIEHSQFIENTADYRCGAISLEQVHSETSMVDIIIDNCEFSENSAERIGALRIIGNISDITISNCRFMENSSDLWTGCMTISNGGSGDIYNCLYAFNSAGFGSSGAAGSSNNARINYINCTFVGNSAVVGGALGLRGAVTSNVINSIFWGNSPNQISMTTLLDTTPCQLYLNYCDIQDGLDSIAIDTISLVHWGDGNVDSQPLFVDILNEDFSLSSVSPCIGVGIDTIQIAGSYYVCPEFDIFGNPRPNPFGTMPDMGAIESALPDTTSSISQNIIGEDLFNLHSFPNPFSIAVTIEYELDESGVIQLDIYNYFGQLNKKLFTGYQKKGNHRQIISYEDLSAGVYFCTLRTQKGVQSLKMIKLK